jgi:serine/threonine protein kinase
MQIGTLIGPYQVIAKLGEGGMGEVYRAKDTRLDRVVALKVAKTHFDERFEREARAVAALSLPHICALYDVGPNYLVMELVDGVPLAGPLPVDQAVEYAAQILDALDAAHKKGITHRDLKPANILVTKHGIKLLDFGLAKQTQSPLGDAAQTMQALTTAGQIVGTLQYLAPEQLQNQPVDARADLFAFGCVLYELLSGRRAFEGTSPDGTRIAFISPAGIVIRAIDSLEGQVIALPAPSSGMLAWSPEGTSLVFCSAANELQTVAAAGGTADPRRHLWPGRARSGMDHGRHHSVQRQRSASQQDSRGRRSSDAGHDGPRSSPHNAPRRATLPVSESGSREPRGRFRNCCRDSRFRRRALERSTPPNWPSRLTASGWPTPQRSLDRLRSWSSRCPRAAASGGSPAPVARNRSGGATGASCSTSQTMAGLWRCRLPAPQHSAPAPRSCSSDSRVSEFRLCGGNSRSVQMDSGSSSTRTCPIGAARFCCRTGCRSRGDEDHVRRRASRPGHPLHCSGPRPILK